MQALSAHGTTWPAQTRRSARPFNPSQQRARAHSVPQAMAQHQAPASCSSNTASMSGTTRRDTIQRIALAAAMLPAPFLFRTGEYALQGQPVVRSMRALALMDIHATADAAAGSACACAYLPARRRPTLCRAEVELERQRACTTDPPPPLLTTLHPAAPCSAEPSASAPAAGEQAFTNAKQCYTLRVPASWEQKDKAGADALFQDPDRRSTSVGVTVNPVRVKSIDQFGSLEAVGQKLLDTERAKVGVWAG